MRIQCLFIYLHRTGPEPWRNAKKNSRAAAAKITANARSILYTPTLP